LGLGFGLTSIGADGINAEPTDPAILDDLVVLLALSSPSFVRIHPASTTPTSSAAAPGPTSGSCPGDMNGKTMKTMSSSSSFDSKANLGQSFRYKMSAEASKLFQTLQESPLPVEVSGGEQGQATTLSSNL